MKLYLSGGAVRDYVMRLEGRQPDLDFAVEAESFTEMVRVLKASYGLRVWQSRPQFVAVRGSVPVAALGGFGGVAGLARVKNGRVDADFTLCRAEAMYTDGRHPDKVTPADLHTDLSRRDFTVNAVAVSEAGDWVDPHNGQFDASDKTLRTVGNPYDRFSEDPLRVARAFRFAVTHDLLPVGELVAAAQVCSPMLKGLPVERLDVEFRKAFKHNWLRSAALLTGREFGALGNFVYTNFPRLWLRATLEDK